MKIIMNRPLSASLRTVASLLTGLALVGLLIGPLDALEGPRRVLLFGKKTTAPILWTPTSLGSALVAWWDAQNIGSLSLSGSNVVSWTDAKSAIVASQATGASQPIWSATALNSKPGITFNGSKVLGFTATLLPTGTAASTAAVAGAGAGTLGTVNQAFLAWGTVSMGQERILGLNNDSAGNIWFSTVGSPQVNTAPSWLTSNLFVVASMTAGNMTITADGGTPNSNAIAGFSTVGTAGVIGGFNPGTPTLIGIIQQIVVTNAVLSTSARQCLEGWESWYDGKAGSNLPGGHPYKLAPPTVSSSC